MPHGCKEHHSITSFSSTLPLIFTIKLGFSKLFRHCITNYNSEGFNKINKPQPLQLPINTVTVVCTYVVQKTLNMNMLQN